MKYKTNSYKDGKDEKENYNKILEIKNGKYIRGQMDKGVLGDGTKGLLQRICNDFGNMNSAKFFRVHAYSISMNICLKKA